MWQHVNVNSSLLSSVVHLTSCNLRLVGECSWAERNELLHKPAHTKVPGSNVLLFLWFQMHCLGLWPLCSRECIDASNRHPHQSINMYILGVTVPLKYPLKLLLSSHQWFWTSISKHTHTHTASHFLAGMGLLQSSCRALVVIYSAAPPSLSLGLLLLW